MHHTGHDETRGYGTKTREWQMDTVLHLEEVKRADTDVSFLTFPQSTEATPATKADFADVRVALVNDRWQSETAAAPRPRCRRWPRSSTTPWSTPPGGNEQNVRLPDRHHRPLGAECVKIGLLDKDKENARARFSKNRLR